MSALVSFIMARSPFLYVPMLETSGTTIRDISGNNRHGTVNSTVTLANRQIGGMSGRFPDFSGGYIDFGNLTCPWTVGSFTVFCVGVMDTLNGGGGNRTMVGALSGGGYEEFWSVSSTGAFGLTGMDGSFGTRHSVASATGLIAAGGIFTAVGRRDTGSSSITQQVNGVTAVASSTYGSASADSSNSLWVGGRNDASFPDRWDGALGHFAVWPSALSDNDLKLLNLIALREGVVIG